MSTEITGDRPGKARLVKLVRDRVRAAMPGNETVEIAPIPDPRTAVQHLRAKLVEEALEYLLDPTPRELADVLEVVRALAHVDMKMGGTPGDSMKAIIWYADRKYDDRGGFFGLNGMYVVGPGETL